MGIPGLATRLEPCAIRYTSDELDGYVAIVDGPALAYFAHRSAAEANKSRLPSYADINAVAIRWLKNLETINIKVSAILFDGGLPTPKRDERSSRLLQMVKRVTQHRTMHSSTYCPIPSQLGSAIYPLLAPALMEALYASDFAEATQIVPGEADDWCASRAQKNPRSIVFTGDTDLIIYDYPPEVLVCFLKDTDILPKAALKVYSPSKICEQLKLTSLVPLAHAVHNDRWKSLNENALEARSQDVESSIYVEFSRRYISKVQIPPHLSRNVELEASLQALDARISEFVLQALSASATSTEEPPLSLSVFLPLLLEDPFQSSAWTAGEELRDLAYSLLSPGRMVIQEYTRKAQGVSVREIAVHTPGRVTSGAAELTQTFLTSPVDSKLPPARYWTLVAMQIALCCIKPPHISLLARVATGEFDNTWSFIHLHSCIQATLYSLRILKQCLAVYYALHHNVTDVKDAKTLGLGCPMTISNLSKSLESLPSIADLFTIPGQSHSSIPEDDSLLTTLKDIYVATGIENRELFEEPPSKKQKKRAKKDKKAQTPKKKTVTEEMSSNAYAVLELANSE